MRSGEAISACSIGPQMGMQMADTEKGAVTASGRTGGACSEQPIQEKYVPGLASVIVPTFNRVGLLMETLDSIRRQTYRPIELIVVDDGSTDGTRNAIEMWQHQHLDDRGFQLRYLFQVNAGAPAARNKGLVECQGEYIQFFDSDDLMHPDKLRLQIEAICAQGCEWSGCQQMRFSGSVTRVIDETTAEQCRNVTPDRNVFLAALCTPVGIYRRELLRRVGRWREDLRVMQDTEYMFRILVTSPKGAWVEQSLCFIRDTPESIMHQPISQRSESAYHSICVVEDLARRSGWYTNYLRSVFGKMIAYYSRRLFAQGLMEEGEYLYQEAIKRLGLVQQCKHRAYHALMTHGGLPIAKRWTAK